MSRNTHTVRRIVGAAFVATIVSTTLGGFITTASAQAAPAMAKCIPGQGNPLNPCP